MNSFIQHYLIVVVPLVISNSLHMIWVKKAWLNKLNIPISEKLFGKNKTWRGFLFLIFINAIIVNIVVRIFSIPLVNSSELGAIVGFTYLIFELPNSFMKRRLGIGPGERPSQCKYLYMLIDKMDSALGLSLVYYWMGYVDLSMAGLLFFVSSITHIVISLFLVKLKIKSSF